MSKDKKKTPKQNRTCVQRQSIANFFLLLGLDFKDLNYIYLISTHSLQPSLQPLSKSYSNENTSTKTECDYLNDWIKNGHICKNLIQNGKPHSYSWGTQKKKKKKKKKRKHDVPLLTILSLSTKHDHVKLIIRGFLRVFRFPPLLHQLMVSANRIKKTQVNVI